MKRTAVSVLLWLMGVSAMSAATTIDRCIELARENYPLIKKHQLLESLADVNISDINKGWLPNIALTGQTTWQSAVPTFPAALTNMMDKLGANMSGLSPWQYRTGIEMQQTMWDGGASRHRRQVEKSVKKVNEASVEVELYALRQRVESLFFAILLIHEQMAQTQLTIDLMQDNLSRMQVFVKNGVALSSDADMLEAQILTYRQQLAQAKSAEEGYCKMLELLTATEIKADNLECPNVDLPTDYNARRPELQLFSARQNANISQLQLSKVSMMPKFSLFAQGFYGNPSLDNFKSMMDRKGSFNLIGGIKGVWNIDAFYTTANSKRRIALANQMIDAERETFEQNVSIQAESQKQAIDGVKAVIAQDSAIVALRRNVRKTAESQLRNGVIDATALLAKITDENAAALNARYHKIQLIQEIYRLKYTLNQ